MTISRSFPGLLAQDSEIPGVWWTTHQVHGDERGSVTEAAVNSIMRELTHQTIRQVNVSLSKQHVLRGMHFHQQQVDAWYIAGGIAQVMIQDLKTGVCDSRVLYPGSGVVIPPMTGHGFLVIDALCLIYAVSHEYNNGPDEMTYQPEQAEGWSIHPRECIRSERDLDAPFIHFSDLPI